MSIGMRLPAEECPHAWCNCYQQLATEPPPSACRYGVKYPALYAPGSDDNANAFNCVQRGHQNSLEQLPHFYAVFAPSAIKVHSYAHCNVAISERYCSSSGVEDSHDIHQLAQQREVACVVHVNPLLNRASNYRGTACAHGCTLKSNFRCSCSIPLRRLCAR
jgi:MAPEG family